VGVGGHHARGSNQESGAPFLGAAQQKDRGCRSPHDFFERHGQDLHCVVPISFPQAAMGAEIEIPGIDGPVNLKIPEGTQSGKELRVRGRGIPFLNEKGHGDLVVKVIVQIPRKLSRTQREVVQKLAELMSVDNKPTSSSLLEKMKDLFN
jgi:molecular chaperone DnaJ